MTTWCIQCQEAMQRFVLYILLSVRTCNRTPCICPPPPPPATMLSAAIDFGHFPLRLEKVWRIRGIFGGKWSDYHRTLWVFRIDNGECLVTKKCFLARSSAILRCINNVIMCVFSQFKMIKMAPLRRGIWFLKDLSHMFNVTDEARTTAAAFTS